MSTMNEKEVLKLIRNTPFVNGKYLSVEGAEWIEKSSPANGVNLPSIACADGELVDKAVTNAREVFQSGVWRDRPAVEKKAVLLKWADLIKENLQTVAYMDTLETGRCLHNYVHDSIPKAIAAIRWFAESVDKLVDEAVDHNQGMITTVTRVPIGVVGIITPWNDPMVVAAWKIAPALLMGNSVIAKPAEQSSYSLLYVAGLAVEAGVPAGVLNILPGYGEKTGKAIACHQDIGGLFFTGSSVIGKKIMEYAGQSNMKKVGLECGGKSAFVLTQNYSDLNHAAEVLAKSIFYNQGQICSAPSRLIIHESIKKDFLPLLIGVSKKFVPGDPFDIETKVGSVVDRAQYDRVHSYINMAQEQPYDIHRIGNIDGLNNNGLFILPEIIDGVGQDDPLAQEEIFGPILVVIDYKEISEAISAANNSRYGLAASVWTDDLNEALSVSKRLEAGIVHINSYGDDDNSVPFGGVKQSGIGKDKSLHAFDEYSELKSTVIAFKE
jgi:acyl-CoA reductase-like NAD-dependent aldehyde dehydrogenase